MKSQSNIVEINPSIGDLSRDELEAIYCELSEKGKALAGRLIDRVERKTGRGYVRRSDAMRAMLKLSDPDMDGGQLSQAFLRRQMNNPSESIPRFSLKV